MSMFLRFKQRQQLRRTAELVEKLADTLPVWAIRAAFPTEDHINVLNKLLNAAAKLRAERNRI